MPSVVIYLRTLCMEADGAADRIIPGTRRTYWLAGEPPHWREMNAALEAWKRDLSGADDPHEAQRRLTGLVARLAAPGRSVIPEVAPCGASPLLQAEAAAAHAP